jgi:hypothetical protein
MPPGTVFRCLICRRQHKHRAAKRCVSSQERRVDALLQPPPGGFLTREALMRRLNDT